MDRQDYRRAIQVCDELLNSPNQYKIDLMRLKAEICLLLGDYAPPANCMSKSWRSERSLGARMGLAKSCTTKTISAMLWKPSESHGKHPELHGSL